MIKIDKATLEQYREIKYFLNEVHKLSGYEDTRRIIQ